jgi:hypothetical protein
MNDDCLTVTGKDFGTFGIGNWKVQTLICVRNVTCTFSVTNVVSEIKNIKVGHTHAEADRVQSTSAYRTEGGILKSGSFCHFPVEFVECIDESPLLRDRLKVTEEE